LNSAAIPLQEHLNSSIDEISYAPQLTEVIDWARSNVRSTIYSCLASHIALNHLYGAKREVGSTKIFGVYDHEVDHTIPSEFTVGMGNSILAPHSRWGDVPAADLDETAVDILASNSDIGWLLAQAKNKARGRDVFIQGHPEYGRDDLHFEYTRDSHSMQQEPVGYYSQRDGQPEFTWKHDAQVLHANWINTLCRNL